MHQIFAFPQECVWVWRWHWLLCICCNKQTTAKTNPDFTQVFLRNTRRLRTVLYVGCIVNNLGTCPVQGSKQGKGDTFVDFFLKSCSQSSGNPYSPHSSPIQRPLGWFSPDLSKWARAVATSVYCWCDRWPSCSLNGFKSAFFLRGHISFDHHPPSSLNHKNTLSGRPS